MSDERRYYENIRRTTNRAQERLGVMLVKSRLASARDERTDERRAVRDSLRTRLRRERNGSRST
jgi:hypothetical protein